MGANLTRFQSGDLILLVFMTVLFGYTAYLLLRGKK
jgi:hypothetical protein